MLEILHFILVGFGNKEIVETLNLKPTTISTIKTRILAKVNCKNLKKLSDAATLYNISFLAAKERFFVCNYFKTIFLIGCVQTN